MQNKKAIRLAASIIFLIAGCSPKTPAWPTPEFSVDQAVQTQMAATTPSAAAGQPSAAPASPTAESPKITIQTTPGSLTDLAGLIYDGSGLRKIQADGSSTLLYDKQVQAISPDRLWALSNSNGDFWLVDLTTRKITRLTMTETKVECCAAWWNQHDGRLLFLSNDLGKNAGVGTQGFLTMVKQDGTSYMVLDADHASAGIPAVSPDGTWIAYGSGETGWLFGGELGPQKVDPADYGLVSLKGQTISHPAWSPDGKKLAWYWQSILNSGSKAGILILDMDAKTYTLGALLSDPVQYADPMMRWSPDGKWIAYLANSASNPAAGTHLMSTDPAHPMDVQVGQAGLLPGVWKSDSSKLALSGIKGADTAGLWMLDPSTWQLTRMGRSEELPGTIYAWDN